MPTVLRIWGLRFVIWPNDHDPPHVHVFSADGEAKITIGHEGRFPRLIENRRMKIPELAKALRAVHEYRSLLIDHWNRIHG
jgi:hypothetical protein